MGDGETDRHQSVEGDALAVERELLGTGDGVGQDTGDGARRERRVVLRHVLGERLHVVGTVGDDTSVILAIRRTVLQHRLVNLIQDIITIIDMYVDGKESMVVQINF